MVSSTRDRLLEVARQLFIYKGVENTTISDIASASEKGRRTIYTYFKNKIDIYNAVIDRESDKVVSVLREITLKDATPSEKLIDYFNIRFAKPQATNSGLSGFRSLITFDWRRLEKIRRMAYDKEVVLLGNILNAGIDAGEFDREKCALLMRFLPRLLQSIDMSILNDDKPQDGDATDEQLIEAVGEFVLQSIAKKSNNEIR